MKPDQTVPTEGLSRRSVLRRSAMVTAVGAFGVSSVTGTAAATDFCPRSPGYWHKHWNDTFGESLDIPPAGTMSKSEIQSRLTAPTRGDTVNIMAKQYLATYLNLYLRPEEDDYCANKEVHVAGIGAVEWEHVKNSAQAWLRLNGWDGTHHTGKKDWMPKVGVEGVDDDVDGEVLKDALDAFNNNRYDDLDCDCGDESSESESKGEAIDEDEGGTDEGGKPDKSNNRGGKGQDNGNGNSASGKSGDNGDNNGNGNSKSGKGGDDAKGKKQGKPGKGTNGKGKGKAGGNGKKGGKGEKGGKG